LYWSQSFQCPSNAPFFRDGTAKIPNIFDFQNFFGKNFRDNFGSGRV
jgi:hypothetical protein